MKLSTVLAIAVLCGGAWSTIGTRRAIAASDQDALLQADHAEFPPGNSSVTLQDNILEPDFTWTDSSGNLRTKSEIMRVLRSEQRLPLEPGGGQGASEAHADGQVGVVQEHSGKLYVLRLWIKRNTRWQLLVYQAVASGAPPSAESGNETCENPCKTVPFNPQSEDQRAVIHAYQAVERAVTAHDSAAWGAHIAEEFFAVTSNSDRPLDKAARMAGLDNQKVGGIAPFPLVSARMFQFGDAMVMISRQRPEHGLPLHVTRVWFKRQGEWLEAYSYQTTIQSGSSAR
jgi:hypothetical protein